MNCMTTTAQNQQHTAFPTKTKGKTMAITLGAIVLTLAALLVVTYLMYSGIPTGNDTPGKIDNAAGVQPQYPPALPGPTEGR